MMMQSVGDTGQLARLIIQAKRFHELLGVLPPIFSDHAGIADAQNEVRALLKAFARHYDRPLAVFLELCPSDEPVLTDRLVDWIERRLHREPLDRIVGARGFWTLDLLLGPATLSPRADTETLVRAVIKAMAQTGRANEPLRCLDLGTGTGAILLALLSEWPTATGIGVDCAAEALATAKANALRHDARSPSLSSRALWLESNWFDSVEGLFDVIVSNPPYIPHHELATLDPEVRDHDPHLALDGGPDGLEAYRVILSGADAHLAPQGCLALEIGARQGAEVRQLADQAGWLLGTSHCDFGGIERVLVFERA
jgi:release factor glutamine methyltransferase